MEMKTVVQAYQVYMRTTTARPYDNTANQKAYQRWIDCYIKLSEELLVPINKLPMPPEAFQLQEEESDGTRRTEKGQDDRCAE